MKVAHSSDNLKIILETQLWLSLEENTLQLYMDSGLCAL